MIEQFIALLFHSRDFGHRAHLKTDSLSVHMALNTFYQELPDLIDSIVEAYQGRYNQILDIPYADALTETDPIQVLTKHLEIIEGTRYQAVPKECTPIHNLIDEVCSLYYSTLYKLRQLK